MTFSIPLIYLCTHSCGHCMHSDEPVLSGEISPCLCWAAPPPAFPCNPSFLFPFPASASWSSLFLEFIFSPTSLEQHRNVSVPNNLQRKWFQLETEWHAGRNHNVSFRVVTTSFPLVCIGVFLYFLVLSVGAQQEPPTLHLFLSQGGSKNQNVEK